MRTFLLLLLSALVGACGNAVPKCTTSNCTGCCDQATDTCKAGSEAGACGKGGVLCVACPAGQVCREGALECGAPPMMVARCTSSNCDGCCDSNQVCFKGTSSDACGASGSACTVCSGAQTCQKVNPAVDFGGHCL